MLRFFRSVCTQSAIARYAFHADFELVNALKASKNKTLLRQGFVFDDSNLT